MHRRWTLTKTVIEVRPIRSEEDYDAAVARIEKLMSAEPDSAEEDELDILFAEDEELFDLGNFLDVNTSEKTKEHLFAKGILAGLPFEHDLKVPENADKNEGVRKHVEKMMEAIKNKVGHEEELVNMSFKLRNVLTNIHHGMGGKLPAKFSEHVKKIKRAQRKTRQMESCD